MIERSVNAGIAARETARLYGISPQAVARHRSHPPATSTHTEDARAVIQAARLLRGVDWSPQDQAEATGLLTLAATIDADPSNISGLREWRLVLDSFRRGAFKANPQEQLELAELVARLSAPPADAWQRAYQAAVKAGATREMANRVATAATDRYARDPDETWHEAMARLNPK